MQATGTGFQMSQLPWEKFVVAKACYVATQKTQFENLYMETKL